MIPILVEHDYGCRYAREADGSHTDTAKRVSDLYNLHRAFSGVRRGVFAVRFSDGTSDNVVYGTRAEAMAHQHHNERWYCYIELGETSMTVCQAASVLRFQAHAAKFAPAERNAPADGGLIVIPRLTIADRARQIAAMQGRIGLPIALGKRKQA